MNEQPPTPSGFYVYTAWKATLMYWLHIAGSVAWLGAGVTLIYILCKYAKWAAVQ